MQVIIEQFRNVQGFVQILPVLQEKVTVLDLADEQMGDKTPFHVKLGKLVPDWCQTLKDFLELVFRSAHHKSLEQRVFADYSLSFFARNDFPMVFDEDGCFGGNRQ